MSHPSRSPSGARVRAALSVLLLALLSGGCLYSFTGGGLPQHIRTIAVSAFENGTTQPLLESEIERVLQAELPRNLGVNLAAESLADAVVRGRVTRYEEVASSIRPTDQQQDQVPVVQREVRITYDAEIYDMREDRPIWRAQSQSVLGYYQPENETPTQAQARAIADLARKMIEGAQSQW